jgi:hypothetical protein
MPIVINELVIRGVVESQAGDGAAARGNGRGAGRTPGRPAEGPSLDAREREAIVAACVEAVLRTLEQMKER